MKEEDFTRLARWVIPGWIAMFSYLFFVAIDTAVCTTSHCLYPSLHAMFDESIFTKDPIVAAVILATLGVPAGFFIYQAYHFFRWNSPVSRSGFTALTSGRIEDLQRMLRDIKSECLSLDSEWRKKIVNHPLFTSTKGDHSFKWRYVHFVFIQAAQCLDKYYGGNIFSSRYRYLQEIKHILGASIAALYMGFLGYLFIKYHRGGMGEPTTYLLFTTASIFTLWFLLEKERQLRREYNKMDVIEIREKSKSADIKRFAEESPLLAIKYGDRIIFPYPSAFFVITLLFVNFLANPYLIKGSLNSSPLFDVIMRLFFSFHHSHSMDFHCNRTIFDEREQDKVSAYISGWIWEYR